MIDHNTKRLELAEANTKDIIERYDNFEYHRLTWKHEFTCPRCDYDGEFHRDTAETKGICPACQNCIVKITRPYQEIIKYDESYDLG